MTSQIGWRATYWPISLSYIAEIQTDEFWTIYVRKYGGDLAKVYPKIRGSWKSATASGEIRDGADLLPEVERNFTDLRPRDHIDHLTDEYKGRRFLSAQTTANQVKQRLREENANITFTNKLMHQPDYIARVSAWKARRKKEKLAYDKNHPIKKTDVPDAPQEHGPNGLSTAKPWNSISASTRDMGLIL